MQILRTLFIGTLLMTIKVYGQVPQDIPFYLNSKQVSKAGKDFYNGKFKAGDDTKTLSISDSLNTKNNLTRPFYIYLVSEMIDKADGALSEALGNACKEFIEYHSDEAIDFLYSNNNMVEKKFIDNWAKAIAGEFMIDCEGKEKQCIKKSLLIALIKSRSDNKSKLKEFYQKVEGYCQ